MTRSSAVLGAMDVENIYIWTHFGGALSWELHVREETILDIFP